jgi:SNF2 family DNA or RNA helicase
MFDYKIEVKPWMLKKSSDGFDFMAKYNNDIPMPLMIMFTGGIIDETKGMVKMSLHGDIRERITTRCMCCGRPITNKISQYFGIGPICGEHNYVNPFDTEEELDEAVKAYRNKLRNTVWVGWIAKSAIVSINDDTDIQPIIDDMPIEIIDEPIEDFREDSADAPAKSVKSDFVIHAEVGTPVRCTDDYSVFLTFSYNKVVVDAVKDLRARFWHPEDKVWEIEYKELGELMSALPAFEFDIQNENIIPDKVTLPADYNFKTSPMKHQIEGIEYGLDHSRWLLADDQGLGKTKQIIDLAMIRKQTQGFKHCLIVFGVNGLKWNWLEEIEKHTMFESGHILGQIRRKKSGKIVIGSNADKIADLDRMVKEDWDFPYFIITNIESLRNVEIATKIKALCDCGIINMVAVDEIHRCKNLNTQQGQGMLELQPTYRVAMTGTPLMNNPLDLFAILKWLGYQSYGYMSFKYHFCIVDEWGKVVGYKNIDQLRSQLGAVMLRRTKGEVLDLPSKIYKNEYVDLTEEQRKLYNQVIADAMADEDTPAKECILATYLKLRQVSGGIGKFSGIKKNPKLDRLEQIVEEAVYSGTKVIVYSNWIEGIKPAIERLQRYNPVVITGETKDADRQSIVNKFQNDPEVKVILGTIGAMGTGLTLTAATEVVFLDEPWTDATKEQACDRAHRIGTKSAVTIHTIMSYGTYDEDVHDIVIGKRDLSHAIVEKKDLAKLKI